MVAGSEPRNRAALELTQLERLRALLRAILPANRFYADKFGDVNLDAPLRLEAFRRLPFTTKPELAADQQAHPPYGSIHTFERSRYCRLHQTSGTQGRPLRWLDTPESWQWALGCWRQIFGFVGLRPDDCLFFPFSFGPFLGFWTAFDAATQAGYLCLAGGGMSSGGRLRFLLENEATVVLCTPTYALHLAEVARQEKIDLAAAAVRAVIVAGEPGGGIPATRERIEAAWGARLFDHSGMTEVGPVAVECRHNPGGLHILEMDYVAEVLEPAGDHPVPPGETGELVLTNLGRWGSPVVRYRTGDIVRIDPRPCPCGSLFLRLQGGVLGRTDDMIHVRGNNVYPSMLEAVIRRVADVAEYRVEVVNANALATLRIEIEPTRAELADAVVDQVNRAIRDELLFRADVLAVPPGALPRYEMKARRLTRKP